MAPDNARKTTPGVVIWLIGRPAAGKRTLATGLMEVFRARGRPTLWLDSADMHAVMTPSSTWDESERERFYQLLAHLAERGSSGGVTVLISATGSRRAFRDAVRKAVPQFVEVWLTCDAEVLRRRDNKALYARATAQEIKNLPGVGTPFEPPFGAEIVLDSGALRPPELVQAVIQWLDAHHL